MVYIVQNRHVEAIADITTHLHKTLKLYAIKKCSLICKSVYIGSTVAIYW